MFPFDEGRGLGGWRRWLTASRFAHTAAATKDLTGLPKNVKALAERRRAMLATFGRLRAVVLVALYFGLIVTAAGFLLQFLPETGLLGALRLVAGITGAFAGLLFVASLALTRLLGQTEADLVALLLLHQPRTRGSKK